MCVSAGKALDETAPVHSAGTDGEPSMDSTADRRCLLPRAEGPQDEERVLPGQGVVPLREICKRLVAHGFLGPYSVEPPAGQPAENAALARQAALNMLAML